MGGKPCIRGLRVTVGTIVGLIASGYSTADILKLYPYLEPEDLRRSINLRGVALRRNRIAIDHSVRILIDMNLAPGWTDVFASHGMTAVHWSTIGDPRAEDNDLT